MRNLNITNVDYNNDKFNKYFRSLENGQLTMNQFVLLNQTYNRIDLSRKQDDDDYYDKGYHDYFAIITQDEIMKKFNIRSYAITSAFKALEEKGYLIRKKAKSGAIKLFAPHLSFIVKKSPNGKNETGQSGKSSTNQKDPSYIDKTTGDTSSVSSSKDKKATKREHQSRDDNYLPKIHDEFEIKNQLIHLKNALIKKHIPEQVIKTSFNFYHDYKSLHDLYKLIFKAKSSAHRITSKKPQEHYMSLDLDGYDTLTRYGIAKKQSYHDIRSTIKRAFTFESNQNMCNGLATKLRSVVSYAHYHAEQFDRYVFSSLRDYFISSSKHIVNKFIDDIRSYSTSYDEIPIMKI